MQETNLTVQNLSKSFGRVQAVKNLSFTVEPGRVTGFLGPNGAGKTTTLQILLALVRQDSGTALIKNRRYDALKSPMKVVGAHLDSSNIHPGRTGRAHMRIACAEGGLDPRRIDPLLDLVGMMDAADRRAGGYSLGMLQRLGLATAMLGDPSVLLLDEPANGLDPEGMRWLRGFLQALANDGRTVFLSSHLLGEIQQMAQDVIIINHGELVTAGSVEELEKHQGTSVIVASEDTAALRRTLEAARLSFAPVDASRPSSQNGISVPGAYQVEGVRSEVVGHAALAAGVPLTHLSEKTTGLEDLFLTLTGGAK